MNEMEVFVARIYLHEATAQLSQILDYLHDENRVRGVTVFRGISGFGESGKLHSSTLVDTAMDLPIVIEFYDKPEKVRAIVEHLNKEVKPGHIVYWPAFMND